MRESLLRMIMTTVVLADERYLAGPMQSTSGWVVLGGVVGIILVGLYMFTMYRRSKRGRQ